MFLSSRKNILRIQKISLTCVTNTRFCVNPFTFVFHHNENWVVRTTSGWLKASERCQLAVCRRCVAVLQCWWRWGLKTCLQKNIKYYQRYQIHQSTANSEFAIVVLPYCNDCEEEDDNEVCFMSIFIFFYKQCAKTSKQLRNTSKQCRNTSKQRTNTSKHFANKS